MRSGATITADIDKLRAARAKAAKAVSFGDRRVEFRSDQEIAAAIAALEAELEHVPPRLNRGIPLDWSMSESIGIDSLWGAGRWRGPILRT